MDIQILNFLNSLAGQNIYLDAVFIFFAVYFPVAFAIFHFIFFLKKKKVGLLAWSYLVVALGLLTKEIISLFYFRIRPFADVEGINNLIGKSAEDASFPSGHTLVGFILAFSIFWINKKWGMLFLIGALLVAISRIIVGVHYPTDILGGILIALVLSLILRKKSK
ncbi:phosphatase PAP2 family protein [Candidatus Parcubacteria bacterium]|nr:phosphatase PAP2 family protein [Candidatus Parcubacteria bacterium]